MQEKEASSRNPLHGASYPDLEGMPPLGEMEIPTGGIKTVVEEDKNGQSQMVFKSKLSLEEMEGVLGEALHNGFPEKLREDVKHNYRKGLVYAVVGGLGVIVVAGVIAVEYGRHGEDLKKFLARKDIKGCMEKVEKLKRRIKGNETP